MTPKNKMPEGWKQVHLADVLDYEQPTDYIVTSEDYADEYKTPVLTAGKSFILGHTNENSGIYNKLPVIIFDDFTTASKFVKFPFKVKSSAMKLLTPKTKEVNLKYVFWLMQTIKVNSVSHKRYYISKYQNIRIPLPPLPTQQKIVSILEKAEQAKQWRKEADALTNNYLKSVFMEMFWNKTKLPRVKIKQVVKETETINPEREYADRTFEYVDISSIDAKEGRIISSTKIMGKEVPSRARQKIRYADIIISTVRPNLNAVAFVPDKLDKEICSTGFCILRADSTKVLPEYLYQISRSNKFIESMIKIAKGASYPAISNGDIFNFEMSLPSIKDQQKFASIVNKVETLKEQQNQSKEHLDNLFNVLMQKAFRGELIT